MKIIYQSSRYNPDAVTGVYVRCNGREGTYIFRVFETATGTGRFAGKPGYGPTLREYDCDGSDLSDEFRKRCILSKQMERLR